MARLKQNKQTTKPTNSSNNFKRGQVQKPAQCNWKKKIKKIEFILCYVTV